MKSVNNCFSVISENDDFVVINKHQNINFHCEDGALGAVVAAEQFFSCKLFSVHRLDKMTSGVLLLAKSSKMAEQLSQLFRERNIEKYYLAISDKKPKKKQGLIKGGMEKSRRSMWKLTKNDQNIAITQFFSFALEAGKRLFVIKPHTGKTHQIRVALKSLGSPICGDPLYAVKSAEKERVQQYDRGYLHAYQIAFTLNEISYEFNAEMQSGEWFLKEDVQKQIKAITPLSSQPWPKIKI